MKDFTLYPEALALKELGFDEDCFGYHLCKNSAFGVYLEITTELIDLLPYDSSSCKAPTYSQAFCFFRENYGYDVSIKKRTPSTYKFEIEKLFVEDVNYYFTDFPFKTYPEAELACLIKLIEIVKRKNQKPCSIKK